MNNNIIDIGSINLGVSGNTGNSGQVINLNLAESCTIDQGDYQNLWGEWGDGVSNEIKNISVTEIDVQEFINYLESKFIFEIAHGEPENALKAFLFAFNVNIPFPYLK